MIGSLIPSSRLRDLPRTPAEVPLLTPAALYRGDGSAGNIVDLSGNGNHLVPTGTPSYRRRTLGQRMLAVDYPTAADFHSAAVLPFGTSSAFVAAIFETTNLGALSALPAVAGRSDPGANDTALLYMQTTGWPTALIRDSGTNSLLLGDAIDIRTRDTVWLAQLQIDRNAAVARYRWSPFNRKFAPFVQSGSIAGFATLDSGDEVFHTGGFDAFGGGIALAWCMVATGVQCQGAGLLQAFAVEMGVE